MGTTIVFESSTQSHLESLSVKKPEFIGTLGGGQSTISSASIRGKEGESTGKETAWREEPISEKKPQNAKHQTYAQKDVQMLDVQVTGPTIESSMTKSGGPDMEKFSGSFSDH